VIVDRAWAKRNMGFDPIDTPPPPTTFAVAAAAKKSPCVEDFRGRILENEDRQAHGGHRQIGLAHVAGQPSAAQPACVEADY
jgi:hypothetical protein